MTTMATTRICSIRSLSLKNRQIARPNATTASARPMRCTASTAAATVRKLLFTSAAYRPRMPLSASMAWDGQSAIGENRVFSGAAV